MLRLLIGGDYLGFVILGVVLAISIALHEFGHAIAADALGDPTPRVQGRITLNPLRHLDPLGTFMLVLAGFGWGKPVEFSLQNLRNRRTGPALIALAGPAMNVLLAFCAVGLLWALRPSGPGVATLFINQLLFLNLLLAVFNLI
ncbi:MAG: site-2 protease family protein, partial [Actinomycetota bacterium]